VRAAEASKSVKSNVKLNEQLFDIDDDEIHNARLSDIPGLTLTIRASEQELIQYPSIAGLNLPQLETPVFLSPIKL